MASPASQGRHAASRPAGLAMGESRAHTHSTVATLSATDFKAVTMTGFMLRAVLSQLNMVITMKRSQSK